MRAFVRGVVLLLAASAVRAEDVAAGAPTSLLEAVIYGDVELVRSLSMLVEVNIQDATRGMSALHFAVSASGSIEKQLKIAELLIDAGANIDARTFAEQQEMSKAEIERMLAATPPDAKGPDVSTKRGFKPRHPGKATPLHLAVGAAIKAKDARLVELLLAEGASADVQEAETLYTPLMTAASWSTGLPCVRALLESGADPDLRDAAEWTALMFAARYGHVQIADALLRARTRINAQDDEGRTALMMAARHGHLEVAKRLLKAGAGTQIADSQGLRALDHAATRRDSEVHTLLDELTEPLEPQRVAVEPDGSAWPAAPEEVAASDLTSAAEAGEHEKVAKLLALNQTTVDAIGGKRSRNRTALHAACKAGHVGVVRVLLNHSAALEALDRRMQTPLHLAAVGGHEAVVRRLLQAGARPALRDDQGMTAADLMEKKVAGMRSVQRAAAEARHSPYWTVGALLERWAVKNAPSRTPYQDRTLNATTMEGAEPLVRAAAMGRAMKLQRLLEENTTREALTGRDESRYTLLHHASLWPGNGKVMRTLLEAAGERGVARELVNARDAQGVTALMLASLHGRQELVSQLLDAGAYINAPDRDAETPLHKASRGGHKGTVELLLQTGAFHGHTSTGGLTSVHEAVVHGHDEVLQLLLEAGGDANGRIKDCSYTALHLAAMRGHDRIVHRLVNAEPAANPKMRDCDGKTPDQLAKETGHASVATFLKEWVELNY